MSNHQVTLAERPTGLMKPSDTKFIETQIPECKDGEALIKVAMLSIDPTIRTWMNDAPGYLPPIEIGAAIRSSGTGVVIETKTDRFKVGDIVLGMTDWQEYAIASDENKFQVIPTGMGIDLATVMNVLGVTGLTAYFGLLEVGEFKEGDVVVVSGAAGATGSVVGQIAKARGASKVIGIAGGPEKCAEVVEKYGFDVCLDYREPGLRKKLREACPKGIDLFFDNVGGIILDDALANIAMHGRFVICGAISQYNTMEKPQGLLNHTMLIMRRGSMKGFIILDFLPRSGEAQLALAGMVLDGSLSHQEHLVHGLENAPDALNLLFSGGNHGKTLVVVDETIKLA